jgi:hypothetical protein
MIRLTWRMQDDITQDDWVKLVGQKIDQGMKLLEHTTNILEVRLDGHLMDWEDGEGIFPHYTGLLVEYYRRGKFYCKVDGQNSVVKLDPYGSWASVTIEIK